MVLLDWMVPALFFCSLFSIFLVFMGYPLFLVLLSISRQWKSAEKRPQERELQRKQGHQTISILVVFRNAGKLLENKINNFYELDYPTEHLELVLVSDGTTDSSKEIAESSASQRVRFFHFNRHQGKTECLNYGVTQCRGEWILFSDADAVLDSGVLAIIARYLDDPSTGGICGRRVVEEKRVKIRSGQLTFIQWDTMIKKLEMKAGLSMTSHDGKVYAVKKELFVPVPPGVTDDAYISLTVVRQHRRFVFDPDAVAYIRTPSRNAGHELSRRKRIVSTSLNGLRMNKALFNPFRYGIFAAGLLINKVLRRLLPFALIGLFFSTLALGAGGDRWAAVLFGCQAAGYGISISYPLIDRITGKHLPWLKLLHKTSSLGYFFCIGMLGTLWGVLGFITGERIEKWDPVKK